MTVTEVLKKVGARNPLTAVTTERVVWELADNSRLVYRELLAAQDVRRVDLEAEDGTPLNGWYAVDDAA